MNFAHWLLLAWTVVILYILGGIWFVQIVVYPLFGEVGEDEYVTYHRFYSSHIPCRFGWHWRTSLAGLSGSS